MSRRHGSSCAARAENAWRRTRLLALLLAVLPALAQAQRAQAAPRPARFQPSVRVDAILGQDAIGQVAGGIAIAAAYNVRVGLDAGIGGVRRANGGAQATGRVDLLARWLTDPFRQSRRALHAGGGLGVLFEQGSAPRPVAIVTLGLDGASDGPWVPGVEIGLGGGFRAGVTLRRASARRR